MKDKYGVIIVGAGVAGLFAALHLPRDKKALIICKDKHDISDSYLAQGGICRLQGKDDFDGFFGDTMRAGHGKNNVAAVKRMILQSEEVTDELIALGVDFARAEDGSLAVTREGGHGASRILYHADCTGKEITSRLYEKVKTLENVEIAERTVMLDIIAGKECCGIVALNKSTGKVSKLYADYTVLACGGIGGIFDKSTNFEILTGDGVAIALKHGVAVDDINYIQIHPTTLYSKKEGRCFLISESVRGEGALLLDKNFKRFCDELQPRDAVTAAIREQMKKDGAEHVWLDMRPIPEKEIKAHFPTIATRCAEEGYDVFKECIPVVPAQHYFMGGIRSDLDGKTSLPRLYAVGETCCNGVHGANRLASNSLLESLVFAKRAALKIGAEYAAATDFADADVREYADANGLFEKYKTMLLKAIKEADDDKRQ